MDVDDIGKEESKVLEAKNKTQTGIPFDIEMVSFYNKSKGKDTIVSLYKDKETGKIIKYRVE